MKGSPGGSRWIAPGFAALATVLALVFYREFVWDGTRMLYGDDMLNEGFQLRSFGVQEIRSGRGFPLWNPFVYGGQPYLAILPGPVFYPTSLLYLLMPLHRAIGWTFVLHTALSGLLAYAAARTLALGRGASVAAGLSFMFTGFVVSTVYGGHDGRMFAMVLMPAAFALLEKGLRSGRTEWFLGLGVVVALQAFTPHIQLMYFSSLALSLYAAFRIVERSRAEAGWRTARGLVARWGLAFAIAGLVAAAQLVPTYRILDVAVRGAAGESGYGFASSWALPAQELTALFLPDLIGSLDTYWGSNPFKLHTEYLGAVPLALAWLAVVGGPRDRRVWALGGTTLVCLLFALGAATPVHRLAYAVVPFIRQFRAPSMMLGPAALMVSLLAGLGWQRVVRARGEGKELPWPWAWAGLVPLLAFGLAAALAPEALLRFARTAWYPADWARGATGAVHGPLRANGWLLLAGLGLTLLVGHAVVRGKAPAWTLAALLPLLVADLWRVDARYVATMRPEQFFESDVAIEHLQGVLEPGERVFPLPEPGGYLPNEMMYYGVPAVTGSQKFRLEWYERLVGGLGYRNLAAPALWSALDVAYLTTRQSVETELLVGEMEGPRGRVYRVADDVPHAWFPRAVEASTDTAAALSRLLAAGDPREITVVEAERAPPAGAGEATVESWAPNELVLRVDADREGLLFVSEVYYPAWRATVDGREVEILRANTAFRGVVVPAGSHRVRFFYSASEFRAGFAVSGAALGAVLLALGLSGVRATRGKKAEGTKS